MGTIYVVRHGQDTDNAKDILNGQRDTDLTSLGKEQAAKAAEKLVTKNIEVIYCSPLKRTKETAEIIAERIGIGKVTPEELLIERDFGIMTGKPKSDIKKMCDNLLITEKIDYFLDVEGAETFPELLKRAANVLTKIQKENPDKNILIVTHGDLGKMLQAAFHGWDWEYALNTPYFDNTHILELHEGQDIIE